jgi:nuclear cap-binding protein subunit 1
MQTLFKLLEDSLVPVASGSSDQLMERGDGSGTLPEDELIRQWGRRWLRVFRRKAAVEESFISEAMANAKPLGTTAPVPAEPIAQELKPEELPDAAAANDADEIL